MIRPEIDEDSYNEVLSEAQKFSAIPVTNFQDGITIILSEFKKMLRGKK